MRARGVAIDVGRLPRAFIPALLAMCIAACSSPVELTFEDFMAHQAPINDQLLAEFSDGSSGEARDWAAIAKAEVEWLDAHPPAPCYSTIHSLWLDAMKELAVGGDPSLGDAVLRYILGAEDAYASADASCPANVTQ